MNEPFQDKGPKLLTFKTFLTLPMTSLSLTFKGLLDYGIKIAATWVACKKLHARIARPFTLRIQHQAIFKGFQ